MPPVSAKEFLSAVWGDGKGVAELTAIGQYTNAYPFDFPEGLDSLIDAAPRHNRTQNIYFGICLRRERWPRATGRIDPVTKKPEVAKRGTEDNIESSWVVWCEFDFPKDKHKGKTCPPELARKMLKEFPLQPSIVVKSGGGIQPYWLLKEPATGDDLWRVKAINKALVRHFTQREHGADPQCIDLARIFRLPGTMNLKYDPPRLVEISWFNPERRYTLDDFDIIPQEAPELPGLAPSGPILKDAPFVAGPPAGGASAPGTGLPRPEPNVNLEPDVIDEVGKKFGEIWFEGARHPLALTVAGMLAYHNVSYNSAVAIITIASEMAGGDTSKRLKDVHDTYKNFMQGKDIQGAPALEKLIDTTFPAISRKKAKEIVASIKSKLPRPPRPPGSDGYDDDSGKQGAEPDFDVVKVIKFKSTPPLYTVIVRKHGETEETEVRCELDVFVNIVKFRTAYVAATDNRTIAPIKQWRWESMFSRAPLENRAAPEEASIAGAIRTTLEEFLEQKKENPEPGDLKSFPGYDENDYFFSLNAFNARLKDRGVKATMREITQTLKEDGWKDDRFRVGTKNPRLWIKHIITNGNGHPPGSNGNGDGPNGSPKTKDGVPAAVVQTFGEKPVPAVVVRNEEPKDMFGKIDGPSPVPSPVKTSSREEDLGDSEPPFTSDEPVDVGFDEEDLPEEGAFGPPSDES